MRITTLADIKKYTSYIVYKGNKEKLNIQKVYICQPVNYIEEGLRYLDIWSGYIYYYTNAKSRLVGKYVFVLDKEHDETYLNKIKCNRVYFKISPFHVETLLANVQSDDNCKKYSNLNKEEIYLTNDNKAVFTSKEEIEQYINDIKNNIIKLPEIEHIIRVTTIDTDSNGNQVEKTELIHLPKK